MALMNAVARPGLTSLKPPTSSGRINLNSRARPLGAVASASAMPPRRDR